MSAVSRESEVVMSKPADHDGVLIESLASGGSPTLHTIGYGRRTLEQFLVALNATNRVGKAKLANYGDVFVQLIRDY